MTQNDNQNNNHDDMQSEFETEFSRPVDVKSFGAKGRHFKFQATEEESRALARRYSVQSVDDLNAECKIAPARKGLFKLDASFSVTIVQSCGISLDPVEDKISGKFTLVLQQSPRQKREATEIDFSHDEEDIEILDSNLIDIGELIAQHLSLEINPYPRRQDATGEELGQKIIKEEDLLLEVEKKNPFAVLKSLKH